MRTSWERYNQQLLGKQVDGQGVKHQTWVCLKMVSLFPSFLFGRFNR